ncbi:MAG: outer membrane protein assembly factor BamB family protein [Solirubrobacterales bacterium]
MPDSVYWTNYPGDTIQVAPLAGGGTVQTLYDSGEGVSMGLGVAIDAAADRIYWANYSDDTIRAAPLAGGGTVETLYDSADGVSDPVGLAIDPAAGRLYWSDGADQGRIKRAPASGNGPVETLYGAAQGVFYPTGVAIDPAAGRIYWTDGLFAGRIRRAPLAVGGHVETVYDSAQGVTGATSVVIDSAAGRIYWVNYAPRTVQAAPIAGGGPVDTLYGPSQGVWNPSRLVVDPTAGGQAAIASKRPAALGRFVGGWLGEILDWARDSLTRFGLSPAPTGPPERIYWGNGGASAANPSAHANTIKGAPLAGGGTVDTLYGTAQGVAGPGALAVLRAPAGTGAPFVSWSLILDDQPFKGLGFGGLTSGPSDRRLTCSRGAWAPDLVGAFLYRAPQRFDWQWRLNGVDIGGATSSTYTPSGPGSYTCRVTASNRAGSATQVSAPVTVS